MQVKIDKSFSINAPIEEVWDLISDPTKVVGCVPGAKITEQVDESNFKGAVVMKIGPVTTDFRGDIAIETLDAEAHQLVITGNGRDAKGKGRATMKMTGSLVKTESGGTEVTNRMEVNVMGRLAQFGARLMEDVSNKVFEQFVECLESSLTQSPQEDESTSTDSTSGEDSGEPSRPQPKPEKPPDPEPIKALPLLFQALKGAVLRFFRKLTGRKS